MRERASLSTLSAGRVVELVQSLVGQVQAYAQASGLCQQFAEVQRQAPDVVLELVDVDHDGVPLLGRDGRSSQGRLPQSAEDQGAQQPSRLRPDQPFGQVDQQHTPLGEDLAEFGRRGGLADDGADGPADSGTGQVC